MKTNVKKIADSKYEVTCEVDEKDWVEAQKKAHNKAYAQVQVKGFRKGHVPEDIARKHVNEGEILNEAINLVLPTAFTKAMEENKLEPFLRPQVNVDKFSTSELTLKFTVVVAPQVVLGQYKGLKVEKKKVEVTDQEIDNSIKGILDNNAELVLKNDAAKKGDVVILDFEGFVNDKPFDGGKASNYELTLGSGQFIPGFEDQLIGVKANDKKDVNVTFPENYVEELKGKKAVFKCVIHEVKEKKVPALNDETVKGLDMKGVTTVAELKAKQKEQLTKQKEMQADESYYNTLVDKITASSKINVAQEVVDEEAKGMKENMRKRVEENGMKWEQYLQITGQKEDEMAKKMKEQAEKNIRVMLTLNEIMKVEKITVDKNDIDAEYKHIADMYKMDVKKVEEILSKDLNNLVYQIKSRKLHDCLVALNK
ncbi:MAG: trigger factor [Bacilli bacterium]|nr:trigger factor [Bacilli bacterium]